MRILILTTLLLAACGGGGGGGSSTEAPPPPPDAKPGGFYTGSLVSDVDGSSIRVDGLVLETGEAIFLSDYGIYTTTLNPEGTKVDAEFEAFALWGSSWDGVNTYLHGNIDATVSERSGINGDYTLGGDSGTFTLAYDETIYESPSSMDALVGDWGYTIPATGYMIAVSIDSAGNLYGQDTENCIYQGDIATVNTAFNAYRLTNLRADCPAGSATAGSGVAYIGQDSQGTVLVFGAQFVEKIALIDYWYKL